MAPNPSLLLDHTFVFTQVLQEWTPIQTRRIALPAPPGKSMSSSQRLVDLSASQELKALTPSQLGSPETKTPHSMGSNLTQKIQKRPHLVSCLSRPKLWMPFKNTSGIQKTAGVASFALKQSVHSKDGIFRFSMLLLGDKVAWKTNGNQGVLVWFFFLNEEPLIFLCKGQRIQRKKGQKMSHMAEYLSPELSCDHSVFFPRKGYRCSLDPNTFCSQIKSILVGKLFPAGSHALCS